MNSAKKNLSFINTFIINVAIFFIFEGTVYSIYPIKCDTISQKPHFAYDVDLNIGNQNKPADFYKTDSVFSFRSEKGYFPSLLHNIGEQASAPFHFKAKQWLLTGAVAGITTALIFADEDIDSWARVRKQKSQLVNRTSPFISEFGSKYGIYTIVATGLVSAAFKSEKGVQTSLLATQAFITSGIWTQIIKQLTGRERPKASYIFSHLEGGQWHGVFSKYIDVAPDDRSGFSYDAFPSGHTATAFSIATVFATQYNDRKAIPVICYSAATLVGISRLTEHEHWASDVFAGAFLGYLSGKQVVRNFNRLHQNSYSASNPDQKIKTHISYIQNGNQAGFSIIW
jgi:membrane-associated phospholipid phosphatase